MFVTGAGLLSLSLCEPELSVGRLPVCVSEVFSTCCFWIHRSHPSTGWIPVHVWQCLSACACRAAHIKGAPDSSSLRDTNASPSLSPLLTPHFLAWLPLRFSSSLGLFHPVHLSFSRSFDHVCMISRPFLSQVALGECRPLDLSSLLLPFLTSLSL